MTRLILSRLAQIAITAAILSFCAFLLIALMPGDPIDLAIAGDPRLTSEDAARLRALHGLDQPMMARYFAWAGAVLEGRFGLHDRDPETLEVLSDRLGLTRERVRQIQNEALLKLKRHMARNGISKEALL